MDYTVESARRAVDRDEADAWVAEFLASPGSDNPVLAEQLTERRRYWLGPVAVPIERLPRWAGPPAHPVLRPARDDEWRDDVDELAGRIRQGYEVPPAIATYDDGQLRLEDGNHRVEALRRAHVPEVWVLVAFGSAEEREQFDGVPLPTQALEEG